MTRVRLPGSVRNQTTVVAAGVVSVALILAAFGLVGLLRHRLIDAERVAARVRADDVVALARTGTLPNPLSFPGEDSGATQVLDAKGKVIAATENIEDDSPLSTLRPDVGDHESVIMTGLPMEEDDRYLIVATTAVVGGKRVTVQAAASLESADDTLATLTRTLLWGVPALILLVAATTRLLVGLALRPVGAITDEVADITQADLHRRVPEPGSSDEIARLAITMNEMLARLEASSARQQRFVADASHEMRSPLASSRAVLEVAALHPGSVDNLLAAIGDSLIDHQRLETLVADLLTLARLDGSETHKRRVPTDLEALTRTVVDRRVEPDVTFACTGPAIALVDGAQIDRVLTNLLDNAARHRRSRTDVTVGRGDTTVDITVDDDGPGVPEPERNRVFEPFTRLDAARTADQGTGLGLAIVAEIVGDLDGKVRLVDSPLGGARFVVSLPSAVVGPDAGMA
ncbi:MAG: HAMP domain-containing protein [Candidatus Microthrix parvicella]|uniref:histidine kinase n=1 Tax=Candidatus Neomicrothrix parvicella RN1 TaxID=1229780 RepID=R4Z2G0_9ACTN|nr:ATP-binding protein [Candidatus Microthrix sp.]NLH66593.1 HAMP domain-containing protein [Candidatus Microthrix parvicella]CCM63471.1 putative Histidine kinase [Candidatus Microthrix parvicella RN1]MBK6501475.1 HAMP domain-containing protein [Candidatus Microthrix sp.]MBK7020081.1 HAMP domain-containing protein [Candidatus Microthrix sp.]MBL0202922.1 HAMP domain-containing protein [Candidatus Microthrix sp.]